MGKRDGNAANVPRRSDPYQSSFCLLPPCFFSRVERSAPCCRVRPPPHRTVRAGFPHTALRVGLVSSVSLPFASRLRFTLIPMDAPPYGRAVSDAPPHSGLSPIAVFRHYSSRHLICIVPFFHAEALRIHGHCPASPLLWPRPTTAFAFATCSPPEFPCRTFRTRDPPMPRRVSSAQASSAESCWLHDVRTLATRDLSNETSRERFTCVVAYSFVWRDSRTSVAHPLVRPSDRLRRGSLRKTFAFCGASLHASPS